MQSGDQSSRSILRGVLTVLGTGLLVLISLLLARRYFNTSSLDSQSEVISLIRTHGPLALFVAALLESVLGIGHYFPGSLVILAGGMIMSGGGLHVLGFYASVSSAFAIGNAVNFLIGRGLLPRVARWAGQSERVAATRARIRANGYKIPLVTYWHPNFSAITSMACGLLKYPTGLFLRRTTLAVLVWNAAWTSIVYFTGSLLLDVMTSNAYAVTLAVVLASWVGLMIWKTGRMGEKANAEDHSDSDVPGQ